MPPRRKRPPKKTDDDDEIDQESSKPSNSDKKANNNDDKQKTLRKVKVVMDPKMQVPLCYSRFFKPEKKTNNNDINQYPIIITISTRNGRKKKSSTMIEWTSKNNPFKKIKLKDIESDLKNKYNTTCTTNEKSFVLFGKFIQVKKYLIENYGIKDDQIRLNFQTDVVPLFFHVTIYTKLGTYITKISWPTDKWTDESYNDFVDEFKLKLEDFKFEYECNNEDSQIEFTINCDCTSEFKDYFKNAWHMRKEQIKCIEEKRDREREVKPENENYMIKCPYKEMISEFENVEYDDTYYNEMSQTIQDDYKIDYHKLDNIKFKKKLIFQKIGDDKDTKKSNEETGDEEEEETKVFIEDKEEEYWITKFNVLSRFSIDGIQNGRFLFKGDHVIVRNCERGGGVIEGNIISNNRGEITALFVLKKGKLPPGVKPPEEPNDKNDEKENDEEDEEEEHFENYYMKNKINDEDFEYDEEEDEGNYRTDFDYDYDLDEEEEEEEGVYTIYFKPDDSRYERYALGLLSLNSMESCPIKNIIQNNNFDRSINKIDGVKIKIKDKMEFKQEYFNLLNEEERKNITMPLTQSEKECVEMVLKNHISIVHGPPGCGKTFSIGLFVYHLMKQLKEEKKRFLLCAYSNKAVESIVDIVSPIAKALNKELLWIPKTSTSFQTKKDYENATESEKCLSIYKIMKRKETEEVYQYKTLQQKQWNYEKIKKIKNKEFRLKKLSDINNRFDTYDEQKMIKFRNRIETNLIDESDIVCCTLMASGKWNMRCFDFDYVIIDEASQADQMTSLIPLIHHPSKIILLGDHNQLDASVMPDLKKLHRETSQSLYQKLLKNRIQHVMLKTQFRMNPVICEFPNQEFYNGLIQTAKFVDEETKIELSEIPTPIAFINVNYGVEEKVYGLTYKNEREANVVELLLKNFKMNKIPGNQIGVITPYHEQSEILKEKLNKIKYYGVKIACVDNFQGCECDFIILSMVRTNLQGNFGFITDRKRLNVSLTRARKGLIIVGNYDQLSIKNRMKIIPENKILIRLCEYYKKKNRVFDLNSIKELTKPVKLKSTTSAPVDKSRDNINNNDNDIYDVSNKVTQNMDLIKDEIDMDQINKMNKEDEKSDDDDDDDDSVKFEEEYDIQSDDDHYFDDIKDLIQ